MRLVQSEPITEGYFVKIFTCSRSCAKLLDSFAKTYSALRTDVHVRVCIRIKPEDKVFTTYLERAHSKLKCKTCHTKAVIAIFG